MKIRTRDKKKKTVLLPVKLETFPSHLHHTHERDGMAHVHVTGGVSTVSVMSVSRLSHSAVEIPRKNDKASQVKCRQRPF